MQSFNIFLLLQYRRKLFIHNSLLKHYITPMTSNFKHTYVHKIVFEASGFFL